MDLRTAIPERLRVELEREERCLRCGERLAFGQRPDSLLCRACKGKGWRTVECPDCGDLMHYRDLVSEFKKCGRCRAALHREESL